MRAVTLKEGTVALLLRLCHNEAAYAATTARVLKDELGDPEDPQVLRAWARVREAREAHRELGGDGLPNVAREGS